MSEGVREIPSESPITVTDPQLKSQKAVDLRAQLEFQLQNKEKQSSPFALLKKKFARASSSQKRGGTYHPVASGARGSEDSEDIDAEFEASLTNRPSNPIIGAQLQRDGYNIDTVSDDEELDLNIDLYRLRNESAQSRAGWCACLRVPGAPNACVVL